MLNWISTNKLKDTGLCRITCRFNRKFLELDHSSSRVVTLTTDLHFFFRGQFCIQIHLMHKTERIGSHNAS